MGGEGKAQSANQQYFGQFFSCFNFGQQHVFILYN